MAENLNEIIKRTAIQQAPAVSINKEADTLLQFADKVLRGMELMKGFMDKKEVLDGAISRMKNVNPAPQQPQQGIREPPAPADKKFRAEEMLTQLQAMFLEIKNTAGDLPLSQVIEHTNNPVYKPAILQKLEGLV